MALTLTQIDPKFNGIYFAQPCIIPENFMPIGAIFHHLTLTFHHDLDLYLKWPKIYRDLFWTTLHLSWKFHANWCNFPSFDLDLWPWPWPKLTQNLMGSILDHPACFLKISCQSVQFSIIWPWPLTLTSLYLSQKLISSSLYDCWPILIIRSL